MKKIMSLFALVGAMTFALAGAHAQSPTTITMGTAGPGTIVYVWVNGLAGVLEEEKAPVRIRVSAGVQDTEAMRIMETGSGGIDASFVGGSSLIAATMGRPPFTEPAKNLRGAFPLGQAPIAIIARADSGIKTLSDLDGKRMTGGPAGIGTDVFMRGVLASALPEAKINYVAMPFSAFASALQDRKVDAIFIVGWPPYPAVEEAAALMKINYLALSKDQIDTWLATNPQHHRMTLRAGINPQQDEDIVTIGQIAHLVVPASLSDDTVYELTKEWLNPDVRKKLLAQTQSWESSFLAMETGVYFEDLKAQHLKLHPGAVKAMKEAGIDIPAEVIE